MAYLLDVNLLIALAWPNHVHHDVAHRWFGQHQEHGWATCPMTQCGFVRISSNPTIIADAVSPRAALSLLHEIVSRPKHVFWPDQTALLDPVVPTGILVGHRQITDAYLLGLAAHHKGRLATLDRGVRSLVSGDVATRVLELVPL